MGAKLIDNILIRESASSLIFSGIVNPTVKGTNPYGVFTLGSAKNFNLNCIGVTGTNLNFISNVQTFQIKANALEDQTVFTTYDSSGNQIVLGNTVDKDYDHSTQTNPTLFIHSDTDPDNDNSEWMSLTHDKTDGKIRTGSGDIAFEGRYYGNLNIGAGGENSLPNITDDDTFKIAFCTDTSVSGTPLVPIICYKRGGTQYWNKLVTHSSENGTYT
jgi:hypothetical protein